ncbi:hypothetical protein SAMN05444164_3756 [Bradyrhizobium erythrophlei]|uniref:Uncharacterized protein n=1 Tax=Bradyrhizobium erythrophlei TaxID=1437360 RepID=A0A1H4Y2Q8_9BRAD|nr:hypothetical protein SAMN05444164_3756 [Bradyrhizobium erythrophlei]
MGSDSLLGSICIVLLGLSPLVVIGIAMYGQ